MGRKNKIKRFALSVGKTLEAHYKKANIILTENHIKYIFGNALHPNDRQIEILNLKHQIVNWRNTLLNKEISRETLIDLYSTISQNKNIPTKITSSPISVKEKNKKNKIKNNKQKAAPIVNEEKIIKKLSDPALKIVQFLKNNKIKYTLEKYFQDCVNPTTGMMLPFDFYLPDLNVCIEYDGEQHFKYVPEFHGLDKIKGLNLLNKQKERDEVKNQFCVQRNIELIRIKYKDNIIKFLETKLKNRI